MTADEDAYLPDIVVCGDDVQLEPMRNLGYVRKRWFMSKAS